MWILELIKENIRNQIGSGENERYGQKFCWQIDGISINKKETNDAVLDKGGKMWTTAAGDFPNYVVERSLWIGLSYKEKEKKTVVITKLNLTIIVCSN